MRLQAKRPVPVGDRLLGGPEVLTCVPLTATERSTLIGQATHLGALGPDCIEWRADYLGDLEADDVPGLLASVAAAAARPLVFTNRRHEEGGHRRQEEARRVAVLEAAAGGVAALVDVEMATSSALAQRVVRAARAAGVGIIRSWHDFSRTPSLEELLSALAAMQDAGADVAKVAVMPVEPDDVLRLLRAGLEARRTFLEIPCILMSMGELGAMSRVGGGYFGSDLTFAVGLSASAPGQLGLDSVHRVLDAAGLRQAVRDGGVP